MRRKKIIKPDFSGKDEEEQQIVLTVANENKTQVTTLSRRAYWTEKGVLFEMVALLKRKHFIKRKKDMFVFFQPDKIKVSVCWDAERKEHLAYLLYRLFNEDYARMKGNRGFFSYAETLVCSMDGIPFKHGTLKKISSKINKEKMAYSYVTKEIDDILNRITKGTNGLLWN